VDSDSELLKQNPAKKVPQNTLAKHKNANTFSLINSTHVKEQKAHMSEKAYSEEEEASALWEFIQVFQTRLDTQKQSLFKSYKTHKLIRDSIVHSSIPARMNLEIVHE
jgi:hypothetical protein